MGITIGIIVAIAIAVGLFFILRDVNLWYWKINERVILQQKTNLLLEKISIQIGTAQFNDVTVEVLETGEKKKIKMENWINHNLTNPNSKKYKIINVE